MYYLTHVRLQMEEAIMLTPEISQAKIFLYNLVILLAIYGRGRSLHQLLLRRTLRKKRPTQKNMARIDSLSDNLQLPAKSARRSSGDLIHPRLSTTVTLIPMRTDRAICLGHPHSKLRRKSPPLQTRPTVPTHPNTHKNKEEHYSGMLMYVKNERRACKNWDAPSPIKHQYSPTYSFIYTCVCGGGGGGDGDGGVGVEALRSGCLIRYSVCS